MGLKLSDIMKGRVKRSVRVNELGKRGGESRQGHWRYYRPRLESRDKI